ncbi:MAG TPA: hypothetical protein DE045_05350 [Oceanospirillaceae bacterium]|nr:hypothetical protein [Oceanospirillaceae bacterium]
MKKMKRAILTTAVASLIAGCANTGNKSPDITQSDQYKALQEKFASTSSAYDLAKSTSLDQAAEIDELKLTASQLHEANAANAAQANSLLPPNPEAGACYARVIVEPTYTTKIQRVEVKPAHQHHQTSDNHYVWEDQRVLVEDAHEHLTVVPAVYKTVDQKVLIEEAHTELTVVQAVYKTVTEKIMLTPAHNAWKVGRGPVEKINQLTGEIMCLVEVPATFTTVNKQVLVSPESVSETAVPAVYKTLQKRVVVTAETTKVEQHPAKYGTIKVRKLDRAAAGQVANHPAEFQDITTRTKVGDAHLEWREILCETNTTPDLIVRLQRALKAKEYNPGPIDGVIGQETLSAVSAYQQANSLATGQLTIATLKKLGVQ